ncbi:MAG: MBL fold metallo-hydrolase, partial [Coriobacteriia bacterium]|nr:MBL fold metallo-hydrolase [Coriobacteriia bacterium]
MSVDVRCIVNGAIKENAYVVIKDKHALIIDPGSEPQHIIEQISDNTVDAILLTHRHFDHIGAAQYLSDNYGAPIYIHPEELAEAKSSQQFEEHMAGFVDKTGFEPGPI